MVDVDCGRSLECIPAKETTGRGTRGAASLSLLYNDVEVRCRKRAKGMWVEGAEPGQPQDAGSSHESSVQGGSLCKPKQSFPVDKFAVLLMANGKVPQIEQAGRGQANGSVQASGSVEARSPEAIGGKRKKKVTFSDDFPRYLKDESGPPTRLHRGSPHAHLGLLRPTEGSDECTITSPPTVQEFVTELCPMFGKEDWELYKPSLRAMFLSSLRTEIRALEGTCIDEVTIHTGRILKLGILIAVKEAFDGPERPQAILKALNLMKELRQRSSDDPPPETNTGTVCVLRTPNIIGGHSLEATCIAD